MVQCADSLHFTLSLSLFVDYICVRSLNWKLAGTHKSVSGKVRECRKKRQKEKNKYTGQYTYIVVISLLLLLLSLPLFLLTSMFVTFAPWFWSHGNSRKGKCMPFAQINILGTFALDCLPKSRWQQQRINKMQYAAWAHRNQSGNKETKSTAKQHKVKSISG